ncbi:U5 small nuclear ribonucleoprotein component, partial [Perkinsus olseni]
MKLMREHAATGDRTNPFKEVLSLLDPLMAEDWQKQIGISRSKVAANCPSRSTGSSHGGSTPTSSTQARPLYDEFGNYIGPDSDVDDASDSESSAAASEYGGEAAAASQEAVPMDTTEDGAPVEQRIVLAEDKKHYPDADEVYPEAEVVFQDEDTQPITQPIIAPTKTFDFDKLEKEVPELVYDYHFLAGLMEHPSLIRNVAVVGALHSGKTLLCDLLVSHTWADRNKKLGNLDKEVKYTNFRGDEISRDITIKSTPLSLVLTDTNEKNYLLNVIDTPGHPNFQDEVTAAMRVSDGAILVVDCVMGVTDHTKRMVKHMLSEGPRMKFVVVLSQLDRLVLELRLPPEDAYFKLRYVIQELNSYIREECELMGLDKDDY